MQLARTMKRNVNLYVKESKLYTLEFKLEFKHPNLLIECSHFKGILPF